MSYAPNLDPAKKLAPKAPDKPYAPEEVNRQAYYNATGKIIAPKAPANPYSPPDVNKQAYLDAISRKVEAVPSETPAPAQVANELPTIKGQTAYDIQRTNIAAKNEAARKTAEDAIKRRMAAQGLTGSGIQEKGLREAAIAAEMANAQEQSAVDVAELQAKEAMTEAEKQRQFQKEQQQSQIASTEKISANTIASTEKMAADKNAIEKQGLTLEQAKIQGYTDSNGKHVMGSAELAQQGLTLDEAKIKGYTDPATGLHVKGSSELAESELQSKYDIANLQSQTQITTQKMGNETQLALQKMADESKTNQINLEASIQKQNAIDAAIAKSYYDRGLTGEKLSETELSELQNTNPLAYSSYLSGQAGKSEAEWQNQVKMQQDYTAALMMNASKLIGTSGGKKAIDEIYKSLGVNITGTDTTKPSAAAPVTSSSIGDAEPITAKNTGSWNKINENIIKTVNANPNVKAPIDTSLAVSTDGKSATFVYDVNSNPVNIKNLGYKLSDDGKSLISLKDSRKMNMGNNGLRFVTKPLDENGNVIDKTVSFNPNDLSKYDLSKGQVYTDVTDFDNPAYAEGDSIIISDTKNITGKTSGNTRTNSVTIPPGAYTIEYGERSRKVDTSGDVFGAGQAEQPMKVMRLVNKDDPTQTIEVYSEDKGDVTKNKTNLLSFEGAWNNSLNPLSDTFYKRWFGL